MLLVLSSFRKIFMVCTWYLCHCCMNLYYNQSNRVLPFLVVHKLLTIQDGITLQPLGRECYLCSLFSGKEKVLGWIPVFLLHWHFHNFSPVSTASANNYEHPASESENSETLSIDVRLEPHTVSLMTERVSQWSFFVAYQRLWNCELGSRMRLI